MSTDIRESTESCTSSSNIFSNFYKDLLSVIRNTVSQYHNDYKGQIEALSDRVIHLEESQEKWITSTHKLMEEYQSTVLKRCDDRIEDLNTTIQALQGAVHHLETQINQPQQIKEELAACMEELRGSIKRSSKITDRLVSDMNQMEVKQEELDKEFLNISHNIQNKKRRFFSWFS